MAYNLNQVAMITGLTTRTLRNHLKQGLLKGEKIDGNWSFSEEELDEYIADPFKKTNRICTIMDFPVSVEEALEIANFFGKEITEHGSDIEFRYINEKNYARFVLAGSEEQVHDLMKSYYDR